MHMRTKRKVTGRRVLSFLLSVALLVSMLPLSGGQAAKAASLTAQGVTYEVKDAQDGSKYICLTGMASDYADFIDGEGTFTIPSEIDGVPVKEVGVRASLQVDQGKKVVVPASVDAFGEDSCIYIADGSSVEEVHVMCQGVFKSKGEYGAIYFIETNSVKDVYFHPADFEGEVGSVLPVGELACSDWTDYVQGINVTVHVSTQTVLDKFNADKGVQREIAAGRLKLVKDIEASGDAVLKAKQDMLAGKISQGEALAEGDYTKGSWSALQAALATAGKSTGSTDEAALDAAIAAMDAALEGMVSLEPIKEAISGTADKLEHEDEYKASEIQKLKDAIAAAEAVPDDATGEDVAALAKAVTDAYKKVSKKSQGKLTISWEDKDSGPIVPILRVQTNNGSYTLSDSNESIKLNYYRDEACTTPAVGQDASVKPTDPGEYYVQGAMRADGTYTACVSNVLKFTITERQVNWNSYQWDEDARTLTITGDMVDFPDVVEVPWYEYMYKVNTVRVKEGVTLTRIGAYAFSGARNLREFQIPSTVKAVGDYALNGCESLEGTVALTGLTAGEKAFSGCGKLQGTASLADTMAEIPAGCFAGCPLGGISIPGGVTAIGKEAFKDSKAFEGADLILPDTVARVGEGSFSGAGIASVRLPEGLESIGRSAFEGNPSLEGIVLPASLTELGGRAFASTGLKQAVIPATVQKIGGGLFQNCGSLSYVEFLGTGYDTEKLLSEKETVKVSGADQQFDTMFDRTPASLAVLCDGTTYETLAGYAGAAGEGRGWPAAILHRTQEYIAETGAEYQADKETVSALAREDYGEAAWNSLQEAIAEAESMLADGGSSYDTITSRQAARRKLAEGAMACLQDALDRTEAFLAGENIEKDYDTESDSWWAVQDAVEDAGRIIGENTAGVAEITAQIQALKAAEKGLAPRATDQAVSALDTAVAAAEALAEGDYTPESWKALQDAIAEAEAVKGAGTISQIEAAQKKVEEAAEALVKKNAGPGTQPTKDPSGGTQPTADPNGGGSTKPTADPNGGGSAKPTAGPNGGTGAKPTAKPQAPKVKKASLKKVKSTKKKTIQVQWKKVSGATGYQVQAALDRKFKKGKKTYTVKKAKTTKKTIKKLKRKKKYFVRVRAYRTVKGRKYYGSWSKAKTVKVK